MGDSVEKGLTNPGPTDVFIAKMKLEYYSLRHTLNIEIVCCVLHILLHNMPYTMFYAQFSIEKVKAVSPSPFYDGKYHPPKMSSIAAIFM